MSPNRPVIRYHGGKWRIAPWIMSHFPPHRIYVEPFGGAGSVLMRKPRSEAEVYNDLEEEIVSLFRVLRDPEQAERLADLLYLTPYARLEFNESYEPSDDPVERARRTIVRQTMSHGTTGLRKGMTGFRSRCWAQRRNEADTWREYPESVHAFVERLRGVVIECRPAVEIIRQHDSEDTLFYVDPPYVLSTRSSLRCDAERFDGWRSYRNNLSDDEHFELLEQLRGLEGMVVLSGYRNELYDTALAEWKRFDRNVRADGGVERVESLYISPRAASAQPELF